MISNNNGRLKPFIHPATFSGKIVESHTDLQISQDLTWTVDATAKGLQGLHFARYLKRSPPPLPHHHHNSCWWTSTGQPWASHTASQCGSLAAQSGTGKVPSASLEGQGGSLALRNKGPSQDLLHEERLSHYQTLNTPQTRLTAFTPYYMKSVTGLPAQQDWATASTTELWNYWTLSTHTYAHTCRHSYIHARIPPYWLSTPHIDASVHQVTFLMDLHAHILFYFLQFWVFTF